MGLLTSLAREADHDEVTRALDRVLGHLSPHARNVAAALFGLDALILSGDDVDGDSIEDDARFIRERASRADAVHR